MTDVKQLFLRDLDHLNKVDADSTLDTLEYRKEKTGFSAETKLMDVSGRRFFLDVNPRARPWDNSSNPVKGTPFDVGYFYKADAYYDRLTGLGFTQTSADATEQDWQNVLDQNHQSDMPAVFKDFYQDLIRIYSEAGEKAPEKFGFDTWYFDLSYVLGLLHPEGKTGGEITNLRDWVYFLQQAYFSGVDEAAQHLVGFLKFLHKELEARGQGSGMFSLRVSLALLAVDQLPLSEKEKVETIFYETSKSLVLPAKITNQEDVLNLIVNDLIIDTCINKGLYI